jgi:hypothetical protein
MQDSADIVDAAISAGVFDKIMAAADPNALSGVAIEVLLTILLKNLTSDSQTLTRLGRCRAL